ncbi:MAG: hypothetical protein KIT22_01495 [Verrucomicrobiae bacterium]|nr:hypothetical protein [Verrucomicrobiae bacterium]
MSLTTVLLKPGEADRLVAGHPWVYSNSILRLTGPVADGDWVRVRPPPAPAGTEILPQFPLPHRRASWTPSRGGRPRLPARGCNRPWRFASAGCPARPRAVW